jgi:hypothetical protein
MSQAPTDWPAFNWADPLLLDDALTPDEKLIRDQVRA